MITRVQPSNVTPPNVPPSEPVKSKISFKGWDEPDEFVKFDVTNEVDEPSGSSTAIHGDGADDIDDSTELWKENHRQFQEFKNSDNKFLRAVGKTGMLLTTGVLGFGTARYGLNRTCDMLASMVAKDKFIAKNLGRAKTFFVETAKPAVEHAGVDIKESKLYNNISESAKKAAENIKSTKVATYVADKYTKISEKESVVAVTGKLKNFASKMHISIPSKEKVKEVAINTVALGSGFAASMTAAGVSAEHQLEKQREYQGAA